LKIQKLLPAGTLLCLASLCPALLRAEGCTNASYYGSYISQLQGTMLDAAGTSYQGYTALSKEVADGNGNVTGTYNYQMNAVAGTGTYTGTYSVSSACVVTETLHVTPGAAVAFTENVTFELSATGDSTVGATTSTGIIISGQSYRAAAQGAAKCSAASLASTYNFVTFGDVNLAPAATAGQLTLDGNGNVSYSAGQNVEKKTNVSLTGSGTYTVNADCTGSMTIKRNDSFSDTFDFGVILGGGLLMIEPDTTAVSFGFAAPEAIQAVMADFPFGGGWTSILYFDNTGPASVTFTVNFIGDNGSPMTVPAVGGTSTSVTIPAGGVAVITAPNSGSLTQGYATFALPPGVGGYGVFRQVGGGASLPGQEAVSPFSSSVATMGTFAFDNVNGLVTTYAIANPSGSTANITVTATDTNGGSLGTGTITLAPHAKAEGVLSGITGLSGASGKQGRVVFSATSGSVAVLGIRFEAGAFTSIPVR